jgi:inward rectifier potassium channel
MAKQIRDPGIGEKFNARTKRLMNKDGTFNVRSKGIALKRIHPFQYLVNVSWAKFALILLLAFTTINLIYATIYFSLGSAGLKTTIDMSPISHFWQCVFFSLNTLTTVGFGNFCPSGYKANIVAGLEAMTGLLGFAFATGLLYGRFSRPSSKIGYSENALIAPYNDGSALMIRLVNLRNSIMTDVDVDITFTYEERIGNQYMRRFYQLPLERNEVNYLPLTWTLVHPIDENSPFYGKTHEELKEIDSELMINLKGHDEGFGEQVHSRTSYLMDDVIWGARYIPSFHVDDAGIVLLDFEKLSAYEKVNLDREPVLLNLV